MRLISFGKKDSAVRRSKVKYSNNARASFPCARRGDPSLRAFGYAGEGRGVINRVSPLSVCLFVCSFVRLFVGSLVLCGVAAESSLEHEFWVRENGVLAGRC